MLQIIKKTMLVAFCFVMACLTTFAETVDEWDGATYANAFASGSGTESSPYVITTGAQFAYFVKTIGKGETYTGKYIKLGYNIDLNSKLLPTTGDFYGDFDGDNHQLLGCVFTSEGYLFKNLYGVVRNLGLKSNFSKDYSSLTYSIQSGALVFNCNHIFTGGKGDFNNSSAFAYANHGQIVYSYAEGNATGWHWTGTSNSGHAIEQGGLVYNNYATILNCTSDIKSYIDGYKGNWYNTVNNYHFICQSNTGTLYNDVANDETQKTYWETWKSNHSGYNYSQEFDATTVVKTVKFDDPMGLYVPTSRQVNKGSIIGALPVPEYDCTFNGWKVGSYYISSTYTVNSDITAIASWSQNIKQQPTIENPEFLVDDAAHASYQWYRGIPTVTNYTDWTSTNTDNGSTDANTYSIVAKKGNILSFDWNVESETYDYLIVTIGNTTVVKESGTKSGNYEYTIPSDGTYTLKVSYTKDSSGSYGSDKGSVSNIKLIDQQAQRVSIDGQTSSKFTYQSTKTGDCYFCVVQYSNSSTVLYSEAITVPGVKAAEMTLDNTDLMLLKGEKLMLQPTFSPENANPRLSWISSDETVVSVDDNGQVAALAFGTATITASTTDGTELSVACQVRVLNAVDVDGDGNVTISDVTTLVDYILRKSPQSSQIHD